MSDDHMDDPLPQIMAEIDQAIAMTPQMARLVKGYYEAFIEEGFTEPQSLYLAACQMKDSPGPPP